MVCVAHLSHALSCIAFPSLQISHLCVFCDILSPKAVYRVSCCFSRPKIFSPGDRIWYHSRTLGAHVLATVVEPSPNGPQFCHIQYIRPGESLQWIMREARGCGSCITQFSRVAGHHPHGCLLASVEGTTVCLEIPLLPPPPHPGRPSLGDCLPPPPMGDCCTLWGEIARGGGYPPIRQ